VSGSVKAKGLEEVKPFAIAAGYEYTFKKDPNTFLKKENPLNVSAAEALKGKIPEDLLKAKAAELKIQVETAKKIPIIETEAKVIPVSFGQLVAMKNFADAANDATFSRQINLILEQSDGEIITYGTKNVGKEIFTDVIIYSKKKYRRDLYFPERFKQNLDKYFGTCLLTTGAKDRIEKGDIATGKLFYLKAANISDNNPVVLGEAAKALLGVK